MIIFNLLIALGETPHSGSGEEKKLMKRIKARDPKALEQIYDLYKALLFGMILSIVKNREEAEDVLQEVFLKIWEKAGTFDEERGHVYSWIIRLSRNKAIDRIRSKGYKMQQKASVRIDESRFTPEDNESDPLETTIFSDRADLVKKALEEIPEAQREVITIAYYRGMTQSEIADYLDLPLGTIKTRTRMGMIKLKKILEDFISQHD